MRIRISVLFIFTLSFLLNACSTAPERTTYDLSRFDDLVVSNSENSQSSPKHIGEGKVEINYVILLRNVSSAKEYVLHEGQGTVSTWNSVAQPFQCNEGSDIKLTPGIATRLDCKLTIAANGENHLKTHDVKAKLKIPYTESSAQDTSANDVKSGQIEVVYQLRLEDFQ